MRDPKGALRRAPPGNQSDQLDDRADGPDAPTSHEVRVSAGFVFAEARSEAGGRVFAGAARRNPDGQRFSFRSSASSDRPLLARGKRGEWNQFEIAFLGRGDPDRGRSCPGGGKRRIRALQIGFRHEQIRSTTASQGPPWGFPPAWRERDGPRDGGKQTMSRAGNEGENKHVSTDAPSSDRTGEVAHDESGLTPCRLWRCSASRKRRDPA